MSLGKEYMAPSVKLQVTPSHALKPSVMICARRRRLARIDASSALCCSYDSSPGLGGFTISARPTCTHALIRESFCSAGVQATSSCRLCKL